MEASFVGLTCMRDGLDNRGVRGKVDFTAFAVGEGNLGVHRTFGRVAENEMRVRPFRLPPNSVRIIGFVHHIAENWRVDVAESVKAANSDLRRDAHRLPGEIYSDPTKCVGGLLRWYERSYVQVPGLGPIQSDLRWRERVACGGVNGQSAGHLVRTAIDDSNVPLGKII